MPRSPWMRRWSIDQRRPSTAGAVGAPGVLILPLQKEFGWQNAEISSAIGIRFLLFGLMAPFAAALINRFGIRRIALSALLLIAAGLLLSLAMTRDRKS